jgi:hypothetical protein
MIQQTKKAEKEKKRITDQSSVSDEHYLESNEFIKNSLKSVMVPI